MKELSEQLLCAPCSLDERSLPKTPWSRWAAQVGTQIEKRRRPDTTWSTERRLEFIGRHWDRSDTERRREELNRVPRTEPPAEPGTQSSLHRDVSLRPRLWRRLSPPGRASTCRGPPVVTKPHPYANAASALMSRLLCHPWGLAQQDIRIHWLNS